MASEVFELEWPLPPREAAGDMRHIWNAAAERGWLNCAGDDALETVLAVVRAAGRAACPLPVMDGFAAGRPLEHRPDLVDDIADGTIRVVLTTAGVGPGGTVHGAEAAGAATHVLAVPPAGGDLTLHRITTAKPAEGLAVPAWSDLVAGPALASIEIGPEQADEAVVLLRLGLAARALAAAERTHELAIRHARKRRQFGKAIGSFGAVQQRTARCHIDAVAAGQLLGEVPSRRGRRDWRLTAELATAYIATVATRIQLGAHHTLAASGYFEESPAPWLFRRVHADVASLHGISRACGSVADVLVESGAALPDIAMGETADRFRARLTAFLDGLACPPRSRPGADDPAIVAAVAAEGLFAMTWPAGDGGRDATPAEQLVLHEEVIYRRLPIARVMGAVIAVGTPLAAHGSAEQKARFLPLVGQGRLKACVGYSEPEAGSDLGSLRTTAVRLGDRWIINGQKLWITDAHDAEFAWLAARTDPEASPPHAGITVFIVPMDSPGITVREYRALSGAVGCGVFYDNVQVPDTARVGAVDGGWEVIVEGLAGERAAMAGLAASLHRQLDDLLAVLRDPATGTAGPRGSATRAVLERLAADVQAARQLVAALGTAKGHEARMRAAMAEVMVSELCEDFGEAALRILGPDAALSGPVEQALRAAPGHVIGGGTNDIQRGTIARGLGLPW
ncbi:acyl-CoA dehydrogenase family protein [Actinoallomurus acaciae]|uniref:Acyl-CoA dehydrogenase family protein n=1 Tax=Actinoallomurus acaciae TaxID=502577 RepID=A0ABV5Y892_9ACTN